MCVCTCVRVCVNVCALCVWDLTCPSRINTNIRGLWHRDRDGRLSQENQYTVSSRNNRSYKWSSLVSSVIYRFHYSIDFYFILQDVLAGDQLYFTIYVNIIVYLISLRVLQSFFLMNNEGRNSQRTWIKYLTRKNKEEKQRSVSQGLVSYSIPFLGTKIDRGRFSRRILSIILFVKCCTVFTSFFSHVISRSLS